MQLWCAYMIDIVCVHIYRYIVYTYHVYVHIHIPVYLPNYCMSTIMGLIVNLSQVGGGDFSPTLKWSYHGYDLRPVSKLLMTWKERASEQTTFLASLTKYLYILLLIHKCMHACYKQL